MIKLVRAATIIAAVAVLVTPPAQAQKNAMAAKAPELTVRPIEDVFTNGPPRIADLSDQDGTLLFVSSVPLACSVVYGETPAFGQVAVDQDMNGGAHTDHHPALAGLKPDTEYFHRVQGTAADLIKRAMLAIDRRLTREVPGQQMLLQVHDELLFEVDDERVDAVRDLVTSEMASAMELKVPLVVETGYGRHWDEAH